MARPPAGSRFSSAPGRLLRRLVLVVALVVAALASPSPAGAGGFTIPLIGARASQKLAFVARPDDTSAVYHNPAGLSLLGPYHFDLSGTLIKTNTAFTRCTEATFAADGTPTGCTVGPGGEPLFEPQIQTVKFGPFPKGTGILPFAGVAGRFGLKRWTFALAAYSPHNATGAFPDCRREAGTGRPVDCSGAAQRFHAVRGTVNTIYITPAVAFEPHPAIAIGVGVSAVRAAITLDRALWLGGPNSTVALVDGNWNGEGRVELAANAWSWAINFGILWNLGHTFARGNKWLRGLRLGLAYSSQTKFDFKSDLALFSPLLYNFLSPQSDCRQADQATSRVECRGAATFRFPQQVRVGLDWEITPEWSVGIDISWQNYKVYKEIKIELVDPLILDTMGNQVTATETSEPKNSTDITSVSVGAQYSPRWLRGLEFRLGLMWDDTPYPNRTFTLLNPDAEKLGFAIGVGYRFKFGMELNVGYASIFYRDRVVRDSIIRPRICPEGDASCQALAPDANFSMNGNQVDKRIDVFSFAFSWRFGGGKPSLDPGPPSPVGRPITGVRYETEPPPTRARATDARAGRPVSRPVPRAALPPRPVAPAKVTPRRAPPPKTAPPAPNPGSPRP